MKQDYTLQDCINAFNWSESHSKDIFVRRMENLSEWRTAAKYWEKIGRNSDAAACTMIAEAIEQGDAYRDAVRHLNEWVDKTVEEGIMEKDEAIKVIYPEMNRIYNQHFRVTN